MHLKKDCDDLFWQYLYKEVVEHVGYVPSFELQNNLGGSPHLWDEFMNRTWREYGDWQAKAINYLIEQEQYKIVYSHYHNVDNFAHSLYEYRNGFGDKEQEAIYENCFNNCISILIDI